jgi:PKD domain-containing protein
MKVLFKRAAVKDDVPAEGDDNNRKTRNYYILVFAALGIGGIIVAMMYVNPELFLPDNTSSASTQQQQPLRIASDSFFKIKVGEESPFVSMAKGGKEPYQYAWDFGDGQASHLQNATHVYTKEGSYRVLLSVTDSSGAKAYASHDVQVYPPNANFTRGNLIRY